MLFLCHVLIHQRCILRAVMTNAHTHHFALSVPPTAFQNAVILKPDIRFEQTLGACHPF